MFAQAISRLAAFALSLGETPLVEGRLTEGDLVLEGPGLPASRVDRLGRVARISLRGLSLRRTFNCDLHLGRRPRVERVLAADAGPLYDGCARFFGALLALHHAHPERFEVDDAGDIGAVLERASRFDAAAARLEVEQFERAYPEPVEILPPDRYRDIVVKPALGCPNAGCSFCAFYAGKRFKPMSRADFLAHLDGVECVFGPLLRGRTGVFLGSASAASLSNARLLEVLHTLRERWGELPKGVATFLDPDHAPKRGVAEWQALADAGMTRVVSGLETGLGSLREQLGKSADLDAFVHTISDQKAAGLPVGLTVLVGVGAADVHVAHREETARAIERMPLDGHDLVYVSPVAGSTPEAELKQETTAFTRALRQVTKAAVAPYAMQRFGYYP